MPLLDLSCSFCKMKLLSILTSIYDLQTICMPDQEFCSFHLVHLASGRQIFLQSSIQMKGLAQNEPSSILVQGVQRNLLCRTSHCPSVLQHKSPSFRRHSC